MSQLSINVFFLGRHPGVGQVMVDRVGLLQGASCWMKVLGSVVLCITLACGMFSPVWGSSISDRISSTNGRAAVQDLDKALDEELPSLQQALPGYQSPRRNPVSLAVAPFSSGPDEPSELGILFTFLVKHRLIETAGYAIETSPMWQGQYRRVVYAGEESFFLPGQDQELFLQRLQERTNAGYGLTGSLAERNGVVHLNLRLSGLRNGDLLLDRDYQAQENDLPSLVADMIQDILGALEIEIDRPGMLRQQYPASLETLREILAAPCDESSCARRQSHLHDLVRQTPFPSAFIWLSETSEWSDPRAVEALRYGQSLWPDHALLQYLQAMHMPRGKRRDPNRERIRLVTGLAARYPDFLEFQFQAVSDLAWCCYTREALALARSLLHRHPAHFRVWLVYTSAVSAYAWNIRGNHQWSRVPERGKRQFPKLMPLVESAVERSLSLNKYESDAWVNRAIHPPGASSQTRFALMRAIELSPHDSWAYEAGMLNFRRVWGGSIKEQMEFFDLAVKNNPRADWPFDLHRSTYVQGSKWRVRGAEMMNSLGCGRGCRQYLGWGLALLLLLLAPVGLLVWYRWKQGSF